MFVRFPFQLDLGRDVAQSPDEPHLRELIEELLFVSPGERVNRPTFGCPLIERVFAPDTAETAAATQVMVQTSLQQWLGALIQVLGVNVQFQDDQMIVTVSYQDRRTRRTAAARFTR
ncbi:MAG TPA: GPW/gp25 family protein [Thermoanaerobaculia bacterium]|nr:GPW/gp25 family protein [Thermoanaerobaculia bacterium]